MNGSDLKAQAHCTLRSVSRFLAGTIALAACIVAGKPAVAQFVGPTPLSLVNGWTDAPFTTSHAMVQEALGIVQFRGAIAGGTTSVAFTLPAAFRPSANVYIPVDMCNSTNGRLLIQPSGVVIVQAEKSFANAQCFTSLDGASYAPTPTGFTGLTPVNGWTGAPFGTAPPAAKLIGSRVHFRGSIATTGTNAVPFTMPASMRPATDVYFNVDLCNATKGRLHIRTSGVVDVEAQGGVFSNAQCFTSLDGAWYSANTNNFVPITPLQNGWSNAPFATSNAEGFNAYGTVYLKGAIGSGSNPQVFTLPTRFRPLTNVYVPVDLCNANKGRLLIQTSGVVIVQAETSFADAQCFTSLEGVSFVQ